MPGRAVHLRVDGRLVGMARRPAPIAVSRRSASSSWKAWGEFRDELGARRCGPSGRDRRSVAWLGRSRHRDRAVGWFSSAARCSGPRGSGHRRRAAEVTDSTLGRLRLRRRRAACARLFCVISAGGQRLADPTESSKAMQATVAVRSPRVAPGGVGLRCRRKWPDPIDPNERSGGWCWPAPSPLRGDGLSDRSPGGWRIDAGRCAGRSFGGGPSSSAPVRHGTPRPGCMG
jgi:hypothetical protein